jgi:shikimate kinase
MQRWIVLVGPMGAGKSAVGRVVAERLRRPFLDVDEEIERAAAMPIAEIFARDGEAFFRAREAEVIARLLAARPGILATGGGAWMARGNREAIDRSGVSVWLDAPMDVLWQRLRRARTRDARPLLATEDPRATLEALVAERAPTYALARLRVPVDMGQSVSDVALGVLDAVRTEVAS